VQTKIQKVHTYCCALVGTLGSRENHSIFYYNFDLIYLLIKIHSNTAIVMWLILLCLIC